jgi:hypothetical protein
MVAMPKRWKVKWSESEQEMQGQDVGMDGQSTYTKRRLQCEVCEQWIETEHVQLYKGGSYRAVQCTTRKKQSRVHRNNCTHGNILHQCSIHRLDPPIHINRGGGEESKDRAAANSGGQHTRDAPEPKQIHQRKKRKVGNHLSCGGYDDAIMPQGGYGPTANSDDRQAQAAASSTDEQRCQSHAQHSQHRDQQQAGKRKHTGK